MRAIDFDGLLLTHCGQSTTKRRSGFQPRSIAGLVAMSLIAAGSRSYEAGSASSAWNRFLPKVDVHLQKSRALVSAAFSMEPDGSLPCYGGL